MNKVVLKEFEKRLLVIDIMLYCVFIVVGYFLIKIPIFETLNTVEYASALCLHSFHYLHILQIEEKEIMNY